MSNQLEKVEGEKFLWKRRAKGVTTYYLRKRTETEDTEISLKTGSIKQACRLRDAWVNSQTNQELGITAAPKKKKRLRIRKALEDYLRAGCPSLQRGKLKCPGKKHLRTEQDAVKTLDGFFKSKHADELDADLLDDYHDFHHPAQWQAQIPPRATSRLGEKSPSALGGKRLLKDGEKATR